MAKIKSSNKADFAAVFEDPRPSFDTIYFFGDGHDKTTLAPVFDQHLATQSSGSKAISNGKNNNADTNICAGAPKYTLALTKATAHCYHTAATGNDPKTNVDMTYAMSMDSAAPLSPIQYFTDGTSNHINWNCNTNDAFYQYAVWSNPGTAKELSELSPGYNATNTDRGGHSSYAVMRDFFYRDANSGYLSGNWHRTYGQHTGGGKWFAPRFGMCRMTFANYSGVDYISERDFYHNQYIGASDVDGLPMYLYNYISDDYHQIVSRHNLSSNNETVMNSWTAAPAASGSNYGGARNVAGGIARQCKFSSTAFEDPSSAGNVCWYTPYFDTSNNYFPFLFQWNKSADTFTRNEDVAITGNLSSNYLNNLTGSSQSYDGFGSVIYNETFVAGGNRYLSVFPLCGKYQVNDGADEKRTIVTYSVNASNPKALTHHSVTVVPATIKNVVFLNDAKTKLGVFNDQSFHIYDFDTTNGWEKTSTLPYQFWAVGRDSGDKIYAASYNSSGYVDIHLITPTVPVSITLTPASSTYDYQGTTINTTVGVSAYNSAGDRIATSVSLTIDGSTMNFGSGATTATVTTSTSADVSQALEITGAGFSDIIARVSI